MRRLRLTHPARSCSIDFLSPVPIVAPCNGQGARANWPRGRCGQVVRGRPCGGRRPERRAGDEGRIAVERPRRALAFPFACGLGTRPAGHAGRHRCRQCRHRRPERRAMGLSPAAAGAAADPDAVHGPGIDRAARPLHRPRSWRTDPGAVWPRLGVAFDSGVGGRRHRLADHRVHRRCRRRRVVRPLALFYAAARSGDAPHHRGERVLQAGRASGADRRPVRIGVLRRRLGRAPGSQGAGARRDRLARSAIAIFCSWSRPSSGRPSIRG